MNKDPTRAPILVTGGAQRLGLAVARDLHSERTPVVITYRKERPVLDELRRYGQRQNSGKNALRPLRQFARNHP